MRSAAPIMIVGEFWNAEDDMNQRSFSGASGRILNYMLHAAGIDPSITYRTCVVNQRPPGRDTIESLLVPKADGIPGIKPVRAKKCLAAKYATHIKKLHSDLARLAPNIVIAAGELALWALTSGPRKLEEYRGTIIESFLCHTDGTPFKIIPIVAPGDSLRDTASVPITTMDLAKAARHATQPKYARTARSIWTEPTIEDLFEFERRFMNNSPLIACDIETKGDIITEVGFAPTPHEAIVVPFYERAAANGAYWPSAQLEFEAWQWVKRMCERPETNLVGQNFLYDIRFLWSRMGIRPRMAEDTMLMHHAYQPELRKGLGMLASLYTDEPVWKNMRSFKETATAKRED